MVGTSAASPPSRAIASVRQNGRPTAGGWPSTRWRLKTPGEHDDRISLPTSLRRSSRLTCQEESASSTRRARASRSTINSSAPARSAIYARGELRWLELFKETAAPVTRAAILRDPTLPQGAGQFGAIQSIAPSLGVELRPIDVRDAGEIER